MLKWPSRHCWISRCTFLKHIQLGRTIPWFRSQIRYIAVVYPWIWCVLDNINFIVTFIYLCKYGLLRPSIKWLGPNYIQHSPPLKQSKQTKKWQKRLKHDNLLQFLIRTSYHWSSMPSLVGSHFYLPDISIFATSWRLLCPGMLRKPFKYYFEILSGKILPKRTLDDFCVYLVRLRKDQKGLQMDQKWLKNSVLNQEYLFLAEFFISRIGG